MTRWPLASVFVLSLAALAACDGGESSPPPSSPPPAGGGETVTGRERIGWTQPDLNVSDVSQLGFAAYVDGARRLLEGAACSRGSGDNYECSAPLPSLSAGRHTLEIAAFTTSGDTVVEGPRSASLQLNVSSSVAGSTPSAGDESRFRASDGLELQASLLAEDLIDPVDVAVDALGRAFVVERRGTMRIVEADARARLSRPEPLLGSRDEGAQALSVALAPDFARSHFVYTLSVQSAEEGSRLFVTRFRELNGTLGQAAVVLSQPVAAVNADGVLRFGPDQAMYIGVGGAAAASGQVLRFLADGRIPADNPGSSPVYSAGHATPAGLAWAPSDADALWTMEHSDAVDRIRILRARADAGGRALRGGVVGTLALSDLPEGTDASGLTIVSEKTSPFYGEAIVSSIGLADLLRFNTQQDSAAAPIRLLEGRFGAIGGVTAGPGGDLYFITVNHRVWGAEHDALVRLRPR
jgi:hypothetical protein